MTSTTEPVTKTFGHVTITTWTDHEGISINVSTAGRRNSTLSATYLHAERAAAEAWYTHIRDAAKAGTPVWQLEAEMSALIDAAQAVEGGANLAARINADLDTAAGRRAADAAALAADIAEIMAPTRHVRPTRTHVFRQPLSPAQLAAIRDHRNGIVHLGNGVTRPMLTSIADKGYGELAYVPGLGQRKVIASLTLNERGHAAAGEVAA